MAEGAELNRPPADLTPRWSDVGPRPPIRSSGGPRCFKAGPPVGRKEAIDMATIDWLRDVDQALAQAKATNKPVLLDFSPAPM